jgi:hypothetical protein
MSSCKVIEPVPSLELTKLRMLSGVGLSVDKHGWLFEVTLGDNLNLADKAIRLSDFCSQMRAYTFVDILTTYRHTKSAKLCFILDDSLRLNFYPATGIYNSVLNIQYNITELSDENAEAFYKFLYRGISQYNKLAHSILKVDAYDAMMGVVDNPDRYYRKFAESFFEDDYRDKRGDTVLSDLVKNINTPEICSYILSKYRNEFDKIMSQTLNIKSIESHFFGMSWISVLEFKEDFLEVMKKCTPKTIQKTMYYLNEFLSYAVIPESNYKDAEKLLTFYAYMTNADKNYLSKIENFLVGFATTILTEIDFRRWE